MIILSDTDVVRKLACCELLMEFLQLLKCPPNEVWVLPGLRFQLPKWFAESPQLMPGIRQFLSKVRVIPSADEETLERFAALDVGEQQLMALLCDDARIKHLVTGDKRALDLVAGLSFKDEALRERLDDTSVFCFEAVMLALMRKRGFSVVQARILNRWSQLPGQSIDGVMLQAFPVGGTEDLAEGVLSDRFAELKAALPPIQFALP